MFMKTTHCCICYWKQASEKLFILSTVFLLLMAITSPAQAQKIKQPDIKVTATDITMAKQVIDENTMSLPGFTVGSRVKSGPGKFSAADALIIYLLKFHKQTGICPPVAVVSQILQKFQDANFAKKAVAYFWKDYSTTKNINDETTKADFLRSSFEWYILTKHTEKLKISNAKLQGFVGSDEAWRKAMDSQRSFWQKSTSRENEYILKRESYRVTLNAQAAIAAAQQAVQSGY